ncbi:MAG: hypothetical protein LT106_01075 [Burkholderiaceae bacterium]|nr:hypothetical protein [Burkholderiaceae bacterium]
MLTLFLQQVQQFSPMKTGLASLPFVLCVLASAVAIRAALKVDPAEAVGG